MQAMRELPESKSLLVRLRMQPDRTLRLALEGELDVATSDHVDGVSGLVASTAATAVVLDLRGLRFIDLHGLRSIERLTRTQEARGVVVTECAASECVERLRGLVGQASPWPADAGVRSPESSPVMSSSTS
jgi:anti-anti-sigma factor